MVNVENVRKVREALEQALAKREGLRGLGFNMVGWVVEAGTAMDLDENNELVRPKDQIDECGTVGCIGGWCRMIRLDFPSAAKLRESLRLGTGYLTFMEEALWLGINEVQMEWLFGIDTARLQSIRVEDVIDKLKHLEQTGEVAPWPGYYGDYYTTHYDAFGKRKGTGEDWIGADYKYDPARVPELDE